MENYAVQLRKRSSARDVYESNRPLYKPVFINPNYIIHKPKRTEREADEFAKLARSGSFFLLEGLPHMCDTFDMNNSNDDMNITIKENISDIFLSNGGNKRPQIILIEGAPGVGKTMLMREIKYLWATKKILEDKKLLLLLPLRDLEIDRIKKTEDLFYCSLENKEDAENCAKYFESNGGNGLVILLDGLDENPQAIQSGSFFNDLEKIVDACIVITSRPHATTKLQQFVSYRVQIIGFTDNRRQKFIQDNLQKNAAEHLTNYLLKHEIIDTLCYIPLNMSIVTSIFRDKHHERDISESQTELTKEIVRFTVFRNLEKRKIAITEDDLEHLPKPYNEIFYYISTLAYKALVDNKKTFTSDEIRKVCPVPTNRDDKIIEWAFSNGLGLIYTTKYFTGIGPTTESLSHFSHDAIQELLAAWYIAFSHRSYFKKLPLMCSIQKGMQKCLQFWSQRNKFNDNFWKNDFVNMWSFYIGLTGGNDFIFKHFLSEKMLCTYMQCKFHHNATSSEHVNAAQCTISKNILESKIKTLLLYFLLQEAPDNEMIECLDSVVTHNKLDISGQPLGKKEDLYLLGYILSRPYLTKQWKFVDISHCEIDDEKFKVLHEELTRNDRRPKPEIKALLLSGNTLKSCGDQIINLVICHKIQHLDLSNNFLKDVVPFSRCGDFLETLDISNNELDKLDNNEALEIFIGLKYLRRLKVLKLKDNNISDDQCVIDAIGLALCYCNSLEELELDGNTVEFEDKVMLLFRVINEIKSSVSNIQYYKLTPSNSSAFLKILSYCDQIDCQQYSCDLKIKLMQSNIGSILYSKKFD